MKKSLSSLALIALLAAACHQGGRPDDVLDGPQMTAFLADAYLLEGFYAVETQYRYDALPADVLAAYDDILARHHTTREAVEHSFDYYARHPELYEAIQDSVMAILDATSGADGLPTRPGAASFRLDL